MVTKIFIQLCVLIALIYIGLWAFSAQQEIWSLRQPSIVTLHVNGKYPEIHYHYSPSEFDLSTEDKGK